MMQDERNRRTRTDKAGQEDREGKRRTGKSEAVEWIGKGCRVRVLGGGVFVLRKWRAHVPIPPGGYLFFVIFIQNIHKITLFQLFQTNFHILDKKIFLMIIMYIYINKNYHSFHLRGVVNKTIQFFQNENPCSQSNPTTPKPTSPHFPTFFSFPSFLSSIPSFIFSLFFLLFSVLNFPSIPPLYFFILYMSFPLSPLDFNFHLWYNKIDVL